MHFFQDLFNEGFLLWNSLILCLLVGLLCPLFGAFLVLKRMVFMGVALPHISSAGIAFALSMHVWYGDYEGAHGADQRGLAIAGAVVFALLAILGVAWLEKRRRGQADSRIGTLYVLATAGSLLLLSKCQPAERGWLSLFKGDIIAVSGGDVLLSGVVLGVLWLLLLIFRKDFYLVSYDPEMAASIGKKVVLWEMLLHVIIGLSIAASVFVVGPLITFGFMVLPVMTALTVVRSMGGLLLCSTVFGIVCAFVGFWLAYEQDLPIGPSGVSVAGGALVLAAVMGGVVRRLWKK